MCVQAYAKRIHLISVFALVKISCTNDSNVGQIFRAVQFILVMAKNGPLVYFLFDERRFGKWFE